MMDDKPKLFVYFAGIMTAVFLILTFWSLIGGSVILDQRIREADFEKDKFAQPHAIFQVKSDGVAQLRIYGTTLSNSWVWVKAVIVDDKNHAVLENAFNLSYYSGSNWSEGDKSESWSFYLPKGNYKLLVYGEDAASRTSWTRPRDETIRVVIESGAVLTRYFLIGAFLFAPMFLLAFSRNRDLFTTDYSDT